MGRVVRHMLAQEAPVLAVPAGPAMMVPVARHTAGPVVPAITDLAALHTMAPADRHIQGRGGHAMRGPAVRAIRVPVEPAEGVHRFADEASIIFGE